MKEFLLPYGKETMKAEIEDAHLAGVLVSELHDYKAPLGGSELVQEALEHPIGTPRLCDMAIGKKKVVVISSDHTRPVPSHIIMPLILKEIRRGNPDAEITILISTGLHRETTREELESKFGPEITEHETIIVHDCDDTDNMVYLGDDGAMRVGWLLLDPPEDEYYDDDDDDDYGPFASNEGFDVNGKYWYYFKTDGEKFVPDDEYELRKIDGDYYCFDEYGRMRTGWINVDGEDTIKSYRLMGSDGRMRTGWYSSTPPEDLEGDIFEDEVNWYYFSSKGEPYMGPEEGSATTSDFEKINGNTYLFNEYGNPVYGLQKVLVNGEETAYYFGDDKQTSCMIKGERRIEEGDGTMWDYYFTESGSHAGRGYTGVKDNYLYYKGKLQKAESKYQMFEIPTGSLSLIHI